MILIYLVYPKGPSSGPGTDAGHALRGGRTQVTALTIFSSRVTREQLRLSPGLPFCPSAKRLGGQTSDSGNPQAIAYCDLEPSPPLRPRHPATRPRTQPPTSHVLCPPRSSQCGGCRRLGPPLAPRTRWGGSCTHRGSSQSLSSPRDPGKEARVVLERERGS